MAEMSNKEAAEVLRKFEDPNTLASWEPGEIRTALRHAITTLEAEPTGDLCSCPDPGNISMFPNTCSKCGKSIDTEQPEPSGDLVSLEAVLEAVDALSNRIHYEKCGDVLVGVFCAINSSIRALPRAQSIEQVGKRLEAAGCSADMHVWGSAVGGCKQISVTPCPTLPDEPTLPEAIDALLAEVKADDSEPERPEYTREVSLIPSGDLSHEECPKKCTKCGSSQSTDGGDS